MSQYFFFFFYTPADIAEVKDWFDARWDRLPRRLVLNEATVYEDLPATLQAYFEIYEIHGEKPAFAGQLHQIFLIRDRLIANGME